MLWWLSGWAHWKWPSFNCCKILAISGNFVLESIYTKRQRQRCNDACDSVLIENKNAFQWDSYRPLIDRMPGGVCYGGGVSAPKGVSAMGVLLLRGGIPVCTEADHPLWIESETRVMLCSHLTSAAGNNGVAPDWDWSPSSSDSTVRKRHCSVDAYAWCKRALGHGKTCF